METKALKDTQVIMHELVLPNDTNLLGNVLGGRVMHLMDMCAAMSAYKQPFQALSVKPCVLLVVSVSSAP